MSWNKQWIVLGLVVVVGLTPAGSTWAGVAPSFGNGNFETGNLSNWLKAGDVGVAGFNVLSGSFSAYLTTAGSGESPLSGTPAVGNTCSYLISGLSTPTLVPQAVVVHFKVRYKTNEGIGPGTYVFQDPFHAELATSNGAVDLLAIKSDGLTPGPGTTVINLSTGNPVPPPPTVPPVAGAGLYAAETPTLQVISQIPYTSCGPVVIKFSICDWWDTIVNSAAFVDDVSLTFIPAGAGGGEGAADGGPTPCPLLSPAEIFGPQRSRILENE